MVYFEAGKYYVGDICYVINREHWSELLDKYNYFRDGDEFTLNGFKCFVAGTAHGDGTFCDKKGREYCVDAGVIGCMPFEALDYNFEGNGGQIIDFDRYFYAREEDGEFHFGDIKINTREDEEDDDFLWNEEYEA